MEIILVCLNLLVRAHDSCHNQKIKILDYNSALEFFTTTI